MTQSIEARRAAIAALMSDDAAREELDKIALTQDGVSTGAKAIRETTSKFILTSTEKSPAIGLQFALSKAYVENPDGWTPKNPKYPDTYKWSSITAWFSVASQEVLDMLQRDSAYYRLETMVRKDEVNPAYYSLCQSINFDIFPIKNRDGVVIKDGLGLDLHSKRFINFVGALMVQIGKASVKEDGVTYVFTPDFFEELNNGVSILKQALTGNFLAGEPISDKPELNDDRLITYFIAQKQLENLNNMIMQYEPEYRTFGGIIGCEPVPDNKSLNRNFLKDMKHSSTEEGKKLLEQAVA